MESADLLSILYIATCAIFAYATVWFLIALYARRNDVADIAWGPGIALVGMVALLSVESPGLRSTLFTALVFFWSMRLSLHITHRLLSKDEDYRYQAWRKSWGRWFVPRSYAQVFLLQGALMIVIAYPLIHIAAYASGPFSGVDLLGFLVWVSGFLIETTSDNQLARHIRDAGPTGGVCTSGLWKYSRHPNYFGEILMWWGLAIPAVVLPYGFVALISPVTITILIVFVSGIPLLEKKLMERPEYQVYARRTSILIPLPQKRGDTT